MPGTQILPKEVLDQNALPGGVRVEYKLTKSEIKAREKYDRKYKRFEFIVFHCCPKIKILEEKVSENLVAALTNHLLLLRFGVSSLFRDTVIEYGSIT